MNKFSSIPVVSGILQLVGAINIGCGLFGALIMHQQGNISGGVALALAIVGLVGGLLLIALGQLCELLLAIETNTRPVVSKTKTDDWERVVAAESARSVGKVLKQL